MRWFITIVYIVVLASPTLGQQSSIYSQYMFNGLAINPAYAGIDDALSVTFLARAQSVGVEGAPNTQTFSAHTPLKQDKVGVGLQMYHETIGITDQTGLYGSYSYRLKSGDYFISFGLQGGVNFYKAEYSKLTISDPGDPVFINDVRTTSPNFGSGVFVYNDIMYAGISMPQMLNVSNPEIIQEKPVFLYGGYVWELSTVLKLKPSTLVKMVNGDVVEWDINISALINDLLWTGVSYRPNNALIFMLEFQATEQLTIGYAYDTTLNELSRVDSGSHEIMLNYRFFFSQKKVTSPRYF